MSFWGRVPDLLVICIMNMMYCTFSNIRNLRKLIFYCTESIYFYFLILHIFSIFIVYWYLKYSSWWAQFFLISCHFYLDEEIKGIYGKSTLPRQNSNFLQGPGLVKSDLFEMKLQYQLQDCIPSVSVGSYYTIHRL